MADPELPPQVILSHDETLHQITLPSLATFLAGLTEARHLLRLHEILEQYRTPTSYHRIDVREVSSSELPFLDLEDTQDEDNVAAGSTPNGGATSATLEDVARIRGDPIILDAGATFNALLGIDASEDEVKEPHDAAEQPSDFRGALEPPPFRASAVPVKALPRETRATSVASDATTPLPPSGPRRRVRELRLDLRTLDAAALFTLETWRRQEMGLDKLDMRVPDSVWYQDDRDLNPPKRKRGRPRKVENQATSDAPVNSTREETTGILTPDTDQRPAEDREGAVVSETAAKDGVAGETPISANAEAEPSTLSRYRLSPTPEEVLPDAYNEEDEQDSDFVPDEEERAECEAVVASGPDGLPKKRRGRPPKQSLPQDPAATTPPGKRGPGRPRKSAPTNITGSPIPSGTRAGMKRLKDIAPSPLYAIAPLVLPTSSATMASSGNTRPVPTPQSAERAGTPRTSIAQTPTTYSAASSARSSGRSSVVVEIRTKRPGAPLQRTTTHKRKKETTDEDEDWGFLRAFT